MRDHGYPTASGFTPVLAPRAGWKYVRGLAPVVLLWAALVGWLAVLLYERSHGSREADTASIREWLDEARNFRKALPELVKEYVTILEEEPREPSFDTRRANKADELAEQLRALAEPTRVYAGQLPLFPEIHRIEVLFPDLPVKAGGGPPPSSTTRSSPAPGSSRRRGCGNSNTTPSAGPTGGLSSAASTGCTPSTNSSGTSRRPAARASGSPVCSSGRPSSRSCSWSASFGRSGPASWPG